MAGITEITEKLTAINTTVETISGQIDELPEPGTGDGGLTQAETDATDASLGELSTTLTELSTKLGTKLPPA